MSHQRCHQARYLANLYEWPKNTEMYSSQILKSNLPTVKTWLKETEYIAGGEFTAADIIGYHLLTWSSLYGYTAVGIVKEYLLKMEARCGFPQNIKNPGSPSITG